MSDDFTYQPLKTAEGRERALSNAMQAISQELCWAGFGHFTNAQLVKHMFKLTKKKKAKKR
jgi:hypothetical protein